MKNTLERRILLFSFLALTLTIAVNTGFSVNTFRTSYRDGILSRCDSFASGMKIRVEAVLNLGLPLQEIDGLNDLCEETIQNDPEIAYCLIETADGRVLNHSVPPYPLASSTKYTGTLSEKVSILETERLGKVYDLSLPLYDFNDEITGRLRIGFQDEVLKALTASHLYRSLMVLSVAFAAVFSIVALFVRFDLVNPIRRLCGLATDVSSGNFDTSVPVMKTRELAMLGDSLGEMARSLRERDEEIRSNYKELEETNLQLQQSYENLESLSSELGRSREMYRSLLDDASDSILVCDDNDNIIMVNKAAERFFGLPRARMESVNIFSFLQSIQCRDLESQFEQYQTVSPGKPVETEIRFWRTMDQRNLLGWGSCSSILDKDGKKLVQIIVRDATREEEIKLNLEKTAAEMARLNQMKNSFLGLASHELKTPLTIIMGYIELLLTEMKDRLDEGTIDMVRHIARASDRLSEIIRDMVDVSMLDSQTVDLVSQEVDANVLVEKALEKARDSIEMRKQILQCEMANDLPLVRCDVDRLVQALGNILGNAIKFTPDKGIIKVKTRMVERSLSDERFAQNGRGGVCRIGQEPTPFVEISIKDTGIGIAEDDQDAIFEKFYEVGDVEEHSTGKVSFKGRGTGLGLSIAKGVVALHGGALWAESPGHDPERLPGSTFFLLLPVSGQLVSAVHGQNVLEPGPSHLHRADG